MAEQSGGAGVVLADDGFQLDRIELTRVSAEASHGVLLAEQQGTQTFSADVILHVDTRQAAIADQISATTDYSQVANAVYQVLSGPHADLIETLAERIAAAVLEFPGVQAVDVVVHKPQAPLGVPVDDITVAIRRDHTHRAPAVSAPVAAAIAPPAVELAVTPMPAEPDLENDVTRTYAEPDYLAAAGSPLADGVATATVAPLGGGLAAAVPSGLDGDVESVPTNESEAFAVATAFATAAVAGNILDAVPTDQVKAILALGSNLGDSKSIIRQAIGQLQATPGITIENTDVGPLARTSPVGGPLGQADFFNTVVRARTTLSPRQLLAAAHRIEAQFGRVRSGEKWGPRTLDIDVVTYSDVVASAPDLTLPHPLSDQRAFVLLPWSELEPDAQIPGISEYTVSALAAMAPDRGGIRNMMLNWLDYVPAPEAEQTVAIQPEVAGADATGAEAESANSVAVSESDSSGQPRTALTPTPKLDLPEWTPAIPASGTAAQVPTFTGIISGVSATRPALSHPAPPKSEPEQTPFQVSAPQADGGAISVAPLANPAEAPSWQGANPVVPYEQAAGGERAGGHGHGGSPLIARLSARLSNGHSRGTGDSQPADVPPPLPPTASAFAPTDPAFASSGSVVAPAATAQSPNPPVANLQTPTQPALPAESAAGSKSSADDKEPPNLPPLNIPSWDDILRG